MTHAKEVKLDVVAGLPIAAFVIDKDHRVLRWNKALESLSGLKAKTLIGTNQHWKAFYKSERPCLADLLVDGKVKQIQKIYAGKITKTNLQDQVYETIDFFPDLGDDGRWVRFTAAVVRDSSGTIIGAIETLEDISEQKQAQEKITRLNLVLRTIRNVNQLIVQENDRDILIQKICDSLIEASGYSTAWIMLLDASGEFLACTESGFGKGFTPLMKELKRSDFPACAQQALEQAGLLEITYPSSICSGCPIADFCPDRGHKVTIRLEHAGVVYGILAVSVPLDSIVDEQEQVMLDEIASDIAFAVYSIQVEQERVKVGQKQQEREEYLKTIFETTSLATIVIEEDTTISMANKEFVNLSGYSKEELEGKMSWTEFVVAEDLKRMQGYHRQRRIETEKTINSYEFRFINKKGDIRDILLRVDMIPGTKISVASLLDITERKQAEVQLRESQLSYQSLFTNIPVGIYRSTPDGEMLAANPALVRMLGYGSEDELIKINIHDLYVDPANREDILKTISKSGGTANREMCLKRKDGQEIVVLDNVSVIYDEHGEMLYFEGSLTDITRRKKAERELEERRLYLQGVLGAAPDAIATLDKNNLIVYWNPGAERLFGYSSEEVIGKDIDQLITNPDAYQYAAELTKTVLGGEDIPPTEAVRYRKDGSGVDVIIAGSPILVGGELIGVVAVYTDISERKRTRQEIETLLDLSRQSSAEANLDELLFSIANRIVEVIPPAEAASIHLYDKERQVIKVKAWAGFKDSEIKGIEFKVDDSLGGRILRTRKPVLSNDISKDPDYKLVDSPGIKIIKSQIAVPLIYKNSVIGIAYADNRTKTDAFSPNDLDFLESIGNQLAGTIENARLLDQVRENQKRLSQSEEQYRSVVEDSPLLICRFLPDGTITFANQEYCKYFGNKNDELLGRNIQSTVLEEDREKVLSDIALLSAESPILISENKNLRRNGEFRWIRWTSRALFDDVGQLTSYQAFGEDITERRQAEQALHQEQEQAQEYLDIARVIMLALNSKGEVTLINQEGNRILGYQEGELLAKNWADTCLPEGNREEDKQVFKKIITGGEELVEYYENPVLTKSGEQRLIAWHNTNIWDGKGNIIGTLSSGEDITESKRVERLLKALNQANTDMGKALKHAKIFNVIADQLKQLDIYCMLFPLDESEAKLSVRYLSYESALLTKVEKLVGIKHEDFSFPVDAIDTFREVVREKKALFVGNQEQVVRQILPKFVRGLSPQIVKSLRIQRSILAPLIVEDQVIGAFSVQSEDLTPADIPFITAFADQLAGAWNKVNLMGDLRKSLDGTIRTIAATVEVRDSYTAGHQERVSDLAAAIAIQMGLAETQVEGIRMAGLIHDLGKINVPAEILSKPGQLSELEFELIKTHPQVGYDLLKDIEFPWPLAQMVLQHHEKMDGSGYPQGLKGAEILPEARILGVADIVEAMSTHRPYRPALGLEKALVQIRKDKGTLLDSEVVDACLKVFEQGYKLPEVEGMFKLS